MEPSPENDEHSYLKAVWVLVSVQEEAGVDIFWTPGQYFERSFHNSCPGDIIAEAAKSFETNFFSCKHPEMFPRYYFNQNALINGLCQNTS